MTDPLKGFAALAPDVFYGVPVIAFEDHDAALTHDRRRAIAALSALHRVSQGESLRDAYVIADQDITVGWARVDDRADGPWIVEADPGEPGAVAVTWFQP
ncbi:hypothetical protein [Streptomyces noursei]